MTTIDIMMPFYGDASLMRRAVESVLGQEDQSWRLTVVDDATDPDAASWIARLNCPAVTYLRNEVNLGVNRNFSLCMESASADYVVFMGCDDVLLPGYVSRMRRAIARSPEAAIFQPGVSTIDESGQPVTRLTDRAKRWLAPKSTDTSALSGEALISGLLRGNWCYFPSLCWRRDAISKIGFRPELDLVLDLALIFDVVIRGGVLVVDPEVTFLYRRHSLSVSSRLAHSGHRFDEERLFFKAAARECRAMGWRRAAMSADLHLTSRLHAASLIPRATVQRRAHAVRKLAGHALLA